VAIASHMDEAGDRLRASRRRAAWKPVDLPALEEKYDELERLVGLMNTEVPRLRAERDRLAKENERLRRRVEELEGGRA
jgi:predicted nuclease with TOPRIM domain